MELTKDLARSVVNRAHPKNVKEQHHAMIGFHSHFGAHKECLVTSLDQVDVFSEMLGSQGLFQVLQLHLSEFKFVVPGVLLSDGGVTMLETINLKQAASFANANKVCQANQIAQLEVQNGTASFVAKSQ